MLNRKHLINAVLFGSLWGILEVLADKVIGIPGSTLRAPILSCLGILILTIARSDFDRLGASTAVGIVASFFKFLNVPFYGCQILAIGLLAVAFDFVYSVFSHRTQSRAFGNGILGSLTIWTSFPVFALTASYVVQNPWWIQGGIWKIAHYVFVQGSIAAVGSFFLFNFGVEVSDIILPLLHRLRNKRVAIYYAGTGLVVIGAGMISIFYR